jgi:tRNA (guanine-N7-)-methyltransferase
MEFIVRPFRKSAIVPPNDLAQFRWPLAPMGPLDIEIGSGVGLHPIQYAKANPERRLIAFEHTSEKFERFQSRLDRHPDLHNLVGVHGEAIRWVTHLFEGENIARCFLLYPNPEPKAPNKRWLRMPFFAHLLSLLEPDGEIHLATNEKDYFEEALAWAEHAWHLKIGHRRAFDQSIDRIPRTHFEKKYLARGETCYEAIFVKISR